MACRVMVRQGSARQVSHGVARQLVNAAEQGRRGQSRMTRLSEALAKCGLAGLARDGQARNGEVRRGRLVVECNDQGEARLGWRDGAGYGQAWNGDHGRHGMKRPSKERRIRERPANVIAK